MKKFYYLVASIAFVLVVIMACEKSAIGVDEIQTVKDDVLLSKGDAPVKVTICHYDADLEESYQITISENGLNGHQGDGINPPHEGDLIPVFEDGAYTPLSDVDGDGIIDCADCYPEDGTIGEKMTWYQDADGDGFGNPDVYIKTCLVKEGYVDNADDCDDETPAILGEYIFEWLSPDGYKHYVNIDSYNPGDGTFTGSGYFIFISHSSGWAVGNEPLTVSGIYNKDGKTFMGTLDYTNDGTAGFSGTVSGCDGLTGTNILIYPYVDGDGDGFSTDEGDCNDDNAEVNPGIDADGDGINVCDDCDDSVYAYSPQGNYVFDYWVGLLSYAHNYIISFDGTTISGTGVGLVSPFYTEVLVGTVDAEAGTFSILSTYNEPVGSTYPYTVVITGTVGECGGITSVNAPWAFQ